MILTSEQENEIYDSVAAYVAGASPLAIKLAISNIVMEYCRETGALNAWIKITEGRGGNHRHVLSSPFGGRVTSVYDIYDIRGNRLPREAYKAYLDESGNMMLEFILGDESVEGHSYFRVGVSVSPTQDMDGMPDGWFDIHKTAIANGAIYWMCSQEGKPWGDMATAQLFLAQYRAQMQESMYDSRIKFSPNGNSMSSYDETSQFVSSF